MGGDIAMTDHCCWISFCNLLSSCLFNYLIYSQAQELRIKELCLLKLLNKCAKNDLYFAKIIFDSEFTLSAQWQHWSSCRGEAGPVARYWGKQGDLPLSQDLENLIQRWVRVWEWAKILFIINFINFNYGLWIHKMFVFHFWCWRRKLKMLG